MPHFVPRWVLILGCLCLMGSGGWSGRDAEALLGVPPMAGRPTPESVTLTLHGGTRPVRVSLALAASPAAGESGFQPLAFPSSARRFDPDGRRVEARAPRSPETDATTGDPEDTTGDEAPDADSPGADSNDEPRFDLLVAPEEYIEIVAGGLQAGTEYDWRLRVEESEPGERRGAAIHREQHLGRWVTTRPAGENFRFAVISDMHFFVGGLEPPLPAEADRHEGYLSYSLQSLQWLRETKARIEAEFRIIANNIVADRPDFVIGLGDHFDLHTIDFNAAFLNQEMAEIAHRETREILAAGLNEAGPMFQLLGNWEGESGDHAPEHRAFARRSRKRFQINPRPETQGYRAGPDEDYYAWRWGDVHFFALNVRGYTTTSHLLGGEVFNAGDADDFTLGEDQRAFLKETLEAADAPYKIVMIHHAVGGRAGDAANSAYGRGGGQAADVGEQAWVHDLMKEHGVQVFFYGHDHVFTDIVVDDIHYTLAGTTGAPWRFSTAETGYETYWPESGHVRVDVSERRMRVELVDFRGEVLYSYEVEPGR